ncbi:hypothetical protein AB3K78_08950 [Leucobacter sp. HNU]|uniref:hypothetical protein n=1 Tax=Leucobacter sp. HNU TaxID=3236805 RepID=UPI003A7FA57B
MKTTKRLIAAALAFGVIGGAGLASATPAMAAGGKETIRSIKILGYNSYSNCLVGTNASQLTLTKQGKTVTSASCSQVSNGTWTGVVWYRG